MKLVAVLLTIWSAATGHRTEPRVERALERAGAFFGGYSDSLRFDAAIGLFVIGELRPELDLSLAKARALRAAADTPRALRRAFEPAARAPKSLTSEWVIPKPGQPRRSTDLVVAEALHCAENGFRTETLDYLRGPMRDNGRYQTTHAAWALSIARKNGCVDDATFAAIADELVAEIGDALDASMPPQSTPEVDLFAERLLMPMLLDRPLPRTEQYMALLLSYQEDSGAFGRGQDRGPYYRYHATMASSWAMAKWLASR